MMNNFSHTLKYIALISLFGVIGFVFGALNTSATLADATAHQASALEAVESLPYKFEDVALTAKAAYVFDITNDESVFLKNSSTQLPLASITKVAVALLAHEHLDSRNVITFSSSSIATEGESGFTAGEKWRVGDLIDFTLMTSSNDGAVALAEAIEGSTGSSITNLLNELAKDLGLDQTYFVNETGLDSSTLFSGTYGSAQDMGVLFAHAYKTAPELFAATAVAEHTFTNVDGIIYDATNTNKAIGELPGLVFGKTGFTDLAGGNLVVVTESEPGHSFVVVVLGSTVEDRFTDTTSLVRLILPALN